MEKKETASQRGRRINKRGKDNEREFAEDLQKSFNKMFGEDEYKIRRTPMSGGMHLDFPADIFYPKAPSYSVLKELHIDCKVAARWDPERWHEEEKELCRKTGTPFQKVVIVARRPGDKKQLAIINWEDLKKIIIDLEGYRREENGK